MRTIESNAIVDLEQKAEDRLVALRDIKRAQIQDYFNSIRDQILTFSENKMVVDAIAELPDVFNSYRDEAHVDDDQLKQQRQKLLAYYTGDFSTEYRLQNDGRTHNVHDYFEQLDDDSIAFQFNYIKAINKNCNKEEL